MMGHFVKGVLRPIISPVRSEIKRIQYIKKFSPFLILLEMPCDILGDVTIGGKTTIEEECCLKNVILQGEVALKKGVRLFDSELSGPIVIYDNTALSVTKLSAYSYIASNSSVMNATIGAFCSIGGEVMIGLPSHPLTGISTNPIFFSSLGQCGQVWVTDEANAEAKQEEMLPVSIGSDVWIGSRVMIKGGVKIGVGAVIGAGAVVVNDIPPYAVVGGVPAKVIRYRFTEPIIEKLLTSEWWNCPVDVIRACRHYQSDPVQFINEVLKNMDCKGA